MRKRLFIFAAAICFALSAFATPAFAEESNLTNGSTNSVVAKIGDTQSTYTTLQAAIDAACKDTASSATITLQSDLELNNEGLRFYGPEVSTPAGWKDITVDANGKKLTLNDLGIYAAYCKVTITNCPELTVKAGTNPGNVNGEDAGISGTSFAPAHWF